MSPIAGIPQHFEIALIRGLLIAIVVLPVLVWALRRGQRNRIKKFFGGCAWFFLGAVVFAWVILFLIRFGGLEIEWRGGYVPVVTWNKTKTDFAAVESNRLAQEKLAQPPAAVETNRIHANWPGFRGSQMDGADDHAIITNWPAAGLKLLWKTPCGGGYSSFAMAGNRAFTLEQRRDYEVVAAYDLETGRELWTNGWQAKFSEYHSDEGPRTTPAYSDGNVYALGATGEFRCLNATNGAVVWGTNIMTEMHSAVPDYGLAASPLVVDDKIILQPDAYHGNSVICVDKHNGKILWHNLDMPMGYATPMLMTNDGERQVVVCGRPMIVGLRLDDGVERWDFAWPIINHERPITQPLLLNSNTLLVSAAYMTGCLAEQIERSGDGFKAALVYKNKNLKTKFASAVVYQGYIYGLDEDILVCLDAATGERKWKDGRYGYGQLLMAGGYLIVQGAEGDLILIKPNPDALTELARFHALNGKSWNAPAIGGGRLLLRNGAEIACYQLSPP
ncbi:MAG TPA: PQQ-binding-like beta-propeller repeat protein [Verrucomicrobiae bacterium]|jgi:outer membrane protein assembly factor BamB|nr:PQQ-binding-like beta-propeller repeat protein [Verrucomicrobiae bacterium]